MRYHQQICSRRYLGRKTGDPLVPYVTDKEQPGSFTTVIFTELFPFSAVRRFLPPLSCTVGSCQEVLPTVDNCTGGTYLTLFFLRPFLHYINRTWSLLLLTFFFLIYFFSPPLLNLQHLSGFTPSRSHPSCLSSRRSPRSLRTLGSVTRRRKRELPSRLRIVSCAFIQLHWFVG